MTNNHFGRVFFDSEVARIREDDGLGLADYSAFRAEIIKRIHGWAELHRRTDYSSHANKPITGNGVYVHGFVFRCNVRNWRSFAYSRAMPRSRMLRLLA